MESEIEPATFRLVAQFLNQLPCVPRQVGHITFNNNDDDTHWTSD
jgi:hypothetical protein